ncbi:hypothetical protein ACPTC0_004668 [Escherichia coli]|jgi:hypothetical protein|uniref:hypothetical protein n=1 Tax=Enterobacteriaceae TaxID=543 RepID=UPI00067A7F2B|nr:MULTISPECIES: hypothetical protein [Enterobacteriaceae]EFA8811025.1 hypothetical protein [Escherichia coli O8:H49]EGF2690829.1 hypothetical protein [Shigella sonnei]EEW2040086.1 hypothetical protein [Escherichia coli]EFA7679413.1 hypothetical protein [Escherichia coli]EFC4551973.1 hypothetical protein [Escherichia coli]
MATDTITIEEYKTLLLRELLPDDELELIIQILTEISFHSTEFQPNSPELVQLATQHSPTYQAISEARKTFLSSIMNMPIFFYTVPLSPEEAEEWEKERI